MSLSPEDVKSWIARIAETAYLPKWVTDPARELLSTLPRPLPEITGTTSGVVNGKWCPFVRVASPRHPGTSYNRSVDIDFSSGTVAKIRLGASLCVGGSCMMWDPVKLRCGLNNNNALTFMEQQVAKQETPTDGV